MGVFESEIVQDEAKRLFGDYQSLMQLGGEYGKFDREGKKLFIEVSFLNQFKPKQRCNQFQLLPL